MVHISVDLLRKKSEHNDGCLSTLQEVSLHQQNIEKIDLLGHACRDLKILYLQNNVVSKIENLHHLKELRHLNLAINNITRIENLHRCESLEKLDLTMNFVDLPALSSIASLQPLNFLRELHLLGNPCTKWPSYREYVVAMLPQLQILDGEVIEQHARSTAVSRVQQLQLDLDSASRQSSGTAAHSSVPITTETGEGVQRSWCPEVRMADHLEAQSLKEEAERKQRSARSAVFGAPTPRRPSRSDFPSLQEGESVLQKNEGQWQYTLEESRDGGCIELEVDVGPYLDTSLIKADVQPLYARLLIKGMLLQLELPAEVKPSQSAAQRSNASGNLLVTMPKEHPDRADFNVACSRSSSRKQLGGSKSSGYCRTTAVVTARHCDGRAAPRGDLILCDSPQDSSSSSYDEPPPL